MDSHAASPMKLLQCLPSDAKTMTGWSFKSVADPDLQIRVGWVGHPHPERRGGPGLKKNFFGPLGLILV